MTVSQLISHLFPVIQQQLIFKASLRKCQNSKFKDNDGKLSEHEAFFTYSSRVQT